VTIGILKQIQNTPHGLYREGTSENNRSWGRALVLGTWPQAVAWAVGVWVAVVVVVGYRPLFPLYLSFISVYLSFISALSRFYLAGISALKSGYPRRISR
jgi:hypothetical protein